MRPVWCLRAARSGAPCVHRAGPETPETSGIRQSLTDTREWISVAEDTQGPVFLQNYVCSCVQDTFLPRRCEHFNRLNPLFDEFLKLEFSVI